MASKSLVKSLVGKLAPQADAKNEAGGTAYRFSALHKLAHPLSGMSVIHYGNVA